MNLGPSARPGVFRVLLFGDSQTAGVGVGNRQRYGDLIEKSIPNVEVFNFAIDGVGIDQEYLAYLDHCEIVHDLVIIGLYVEDAARVSSQFLRFNDQNGKEIYYAKPYYELRNSALILNQVPVPKRPWTKETLPQDAAPSSLDDAGFSLPSPNRASDDRARSPRQAGNHGVKTGPPDPAGDWSPARSWLRLAGQSRLAATLRDSQNVDLQEPDPGHVDSDSHAGVR